MTPTCSRCLSSAQSCRCCANGLCADHLTIDRICNACELGYYESRDRLPLRAWFALGLALPWAAFAAFATSVDLPARSGGLRAITTGFPLLDVAIMTAVVSVFSAKAVVAVRSWFHRRWFESLFVEARR